MSIHAQEHLTALHYQLEETTREGRALVAGLSEAQLRWRPPTGGWSVAQCLDHLRNTGELYYPRVEEALEKAPAGGDGVYRPGGFGRLFIFLAGPRSRLRLRAFGIFQPAETPEPQAAARFFEQRTRLAALLERAVGRDLQRIRISSPLSRWLSLSLGECLTMLVAHQQRHLQQARRVTEIPGFPAPHPESAR